MYLLSILLASAALPATLPDSVLFNDAPATMKQMRTIEGRWATSRNAHVMTFSAVQPGWMLLKVEMSDYDWGGVKTPFPIAVTVHEGRLFLNLPIRYSLPPQYFLSTYQGKDCYGVAAVVKAGRRISLAAFDEEKMRAANSWYPREYATWETEHQLGCSDLVLRAEGAAHRRVVVVLEKRKWFDDEYRRVPAPALDKPDVAH